MAFLNICGFESGDTAECNSTSGTYSIQTTTKRTGTYALKCNPAAGGGYISLGGLNTDGTATTLPSTWYATFYFRHNGYTNPGAGNNNIYIATAGSAYTSPWTRTWTLAVDETDDITFSSSGGSASFTSNKGEWYRVEVYSVASGTVSCTIYNSSGTQVLTKSTASGADAPNYLFLGTNSTGGAGTSTELYYDDIAISSTAPGAGQVNILKPNATGTYSGINGVGTAPTNVDDVPHNSDTDYIYLNPLGGVVAATMNMDSSSTGGVSGAIRTVKSVVVARNNDTGNPDVPFGVRLRSSSTDSDSSTATLTSSYVARCKLNDTDPSTSAAWSSTGVDSVQVGAYVSNGTYDQARITAIYAMVWSAGPTAYTQSVSGTSGALSGSLAKRAGKALSGVAGSASGSLSRVTNKALAGTSGTLSGSIVADFIAGGIEYLQSVSGAIGTLTGSLAKATNKSLSGAMGASAGELSRMVNKALSGSLASLSASLSRVTMKSLSGVSGALSGALSAGKTTALALAGAISTISGTLATGVVYAKALTGELSSILGNVSRITFKGLSGSSGAVLGAFSATRLYTKTIAGEIATITGSVTRFVTKSFSGVITGSGILSTAASFYRTVTGSLSSLSGSFSFRSIIRRVKMKGGSVVRSVISGGSRILR